MGGKKTPKLKSVCISNKVLESQRHGGLKPFSTFRAQKEGGGVRSFLNDEFRKIMYFLTLVM
jgi:hypothetical protein